MCHRDAQSRPGDPPQCDFFPNPSCFLRFFVMPKSTLLVMNGWEETVVLKSFSSVEAVLHAQSLQTFHVQGLWDSLQVLAFASQEVSRRPMISLYPYYSGLEGHGLGGLKLKTHRNTHAATQWFKKKKKVDFPKFQPGKDAQLLCFSLGSMSLLQHSDVLNAPVQWKSYRW